ncbi:Mitogen-activated protein kinase kinase kinase 5 [Nymphon striatum]|nr:Mitogen-activated protein kinase kinase kinase 5 [Nymphon striatum]
MKCKKLKKMIDQERTRSFILINERDKLHLEQLVGQGRCCRVYAGVDLSNADIAIKIFLPGSQYNGAYQREIAVLFSDVQEKSYLGEFNFNGFLTGTYDGCNYIVMEKLHQSLRSILSEKTGKPSLQFICLLAQHLALAMRELHNKGYVHGDIKPSNVMWSPYSSSFKLIDFGLSYHYTEKLKYKIQSEHFKSPECKDYEKSHSEPFISQPSYPADMWSFGCLLFMAVTGEQVISDPNCLCSCDQNENNCVLQIQIKSNLEKISCESLPEMLLKQLISSCLNCNYSLHDLTELCCSIGPVTDSYLEFENNIPSFIIEFSNWKYAKKSVEEIKVKIKSQKSVRVSYYHNHRNCDEQYRKWKHPMQLEYNQDIAILRGACLSVSQDISQETELTESDLLKAFEIIKNAIINIKNRNHSKDEIRRVHAVCFFHFCREKIHVNVNQQYFKSVDVNFPFLSDFYLLLLSFFDWKVYASEFFAIVGNDIFSKIVNFSLNYLTSHKFPLIQKIILYTFFMESLRSKITGSVNQFQTSCDTALNLDSASPCALGKIISVLQQRNPLKLIEALNRHADIVTIEQLLQFCSETIVQTNFKVEIYELISVILKNKSSSERITFVEMFHKYHGLEETWIIQDNFEEEFRCLMNQLVDYNEEHLFKFLMMALQNAKYVVQKAVELAFNNSKLTAIYVKIVSNIHGMFLNDINGFAFVKILMQHFLQISAYEKRRRPAVNFVTGILDSILEKELKLDFNHEASSTYKIDDVFKLLCFFDISDHDFISNAIEYRVLLYQIFKKASKFNPTKKASVIHTNRFSPVQKLMQEIEKSCLTPFGYESCIIVIAKVLPTFIFDEWKDLLFILKKNTNFIELAEQKKMGLHINAMFIEIVVSFISVLLMQKKLTATSLQHLVQCISKIVKEIMDDFICESKQYEFEMVLIVTELFRLHKILCEHEMKSQLPYLISEIEKTIVSKGIYLNDSETFSSKILKS